MGFENAPRTIGIDLVEFGSDRNIDQASNAGEDPIRRVDRVEIKAKCPGVDLSCESIGLIVY